MISDTTLTNLSNGLGVAAMLLIVVYHFVAVNGKRMEAQGGKTIGDIVSIKDEETLPCLRSRKSRADHIVGAQAIEDLGACRQFEHSDRRSRWYRAVLKYVEYVSSSRQWSLSRSTHVLRGAVTRMRVYNAGKLVVDCTSE